MQHVALRGSTVYSEATAAAARYQCAACMKTLTNTGFNSFFKGCGHVLCSPCVEKVISGAMPQCCSALHGCSLVFKEL